MSKTLLQLLVENLSEWPEGVTLAVQNSSGWVRFGEHESRVVFDRDRHYWVGTGHKWWDVGLVL